MALVTRPAKTGGNTTYVAEVAGGNTTAKASEVDGDLAALITQVNGNLEAVNLATDAVETDKIKDLNVTNAKLAVGAAADSFGLLGVTSAYLGPAAIFRSRQNAAVPTGLNITTVETAIVTMPALTVIAGANVIILGQWAIYAVTTSNTSRQVDIILYRDVTELVHRRFYVEADGVTGHVFPLPTYVDFDIAPGAGAYVYSYKATTENADCAIQSDATYTGGGWAIAT